MTDDYSRITPEHIDQAVYNLEQRRFESEEVYRAARTVLWLAYVLTAAAGGLLINAVCYFAVRRAQSIGQDPLPWVLATSPVLGLMVGIGSAALWWARRHYQRLGGKF